MSLNSQGSSQGPCLKEGHVYCKSGLWSSGQRPGNLGAASTGYGPWQILPFICASFSSSAREWGDISPLSSRLWSVLRTFPESRRRNMVGSGRVHTLPSGLSPWRFRLGTNDMAEGGSTWCSNSPQRPFPLMPLLLRLTPRSQVSVMCVPFYPPTTPMGISTLSSFSVGPPFIE